MKAAIVYFSQKGTTEKVAECIANGIKKHGIETDTFNIVHNQPHDVSRYDCLGIGTPVYIQRPVLPIMDYIRSLPDSSEKPFFTFVTYGGDPGDCVKRLHKALEKKNGVDAGNFLCRGANHFLGFRKRRILFAPNNPTQEELTKAFDFGCTISNRLLKGDLTENKYEGETNAVYRIERFHTSKPFTKVYSLLFNVDRNKCVQCGKCGSVCPTNNISASPPLWGRNCILCGMCELECPQQAIGSVLDWFVFAPFIQFNIRKIKQLGKVDFTLT